MMKRFALLSVAAIAVTASSASAASERGYRVRYVADSRDYCVTPTAPSEAERLGIALHRTECHTMAAWAKMGVTFTLS